MITATPLVPSIHALPGQAGGDLRCFPDLYAALASDPADQVITL
jgi:hypothetical protein